MPCKGSSLPPSPPPFIFAVPAPKYGRPLILTLAFPKGHCFLLISEICNSHVYFSPRSCSSLHTVADPGLQISERGGYPDPLWDKRGRSQKKFFSALWASFWSKHMGGGAHGSATDIAVINYVWGKECLLKWTMVRWLSCEDKENCCRNFFRLSFSFALVHLFFKNRW